jgi:hypothetical protein
MKASEAEIGRWYYDYLNERVLLCIDKLYNGVVFATNSLGYNIYTYVKPESVEPIEGGWDWVPPPKYRPFTLEELLQHRDRRFFNHLDREMQLKSIDLLDDNYRAVFNFITNGIYRSYTPRQIVDTVRFSDGKPCGVAL